MIAHPLLVQYNRGREPEFDDWPDYADQVDYSDPTNLVGLLVLVLVGFGIYRLIQWLDDFFAGRIANALIGTIALSPVGFLVGFTVKQIVGIWTNNPQSTLWSVLFAVYVTCALGLIAALLGGVAARAIYWLWRRIRQ